MGLVGPHDPGPELHDLMLNMVSTCPLSPRYNTSYQSQKHNWNYSLKFFFGIIHYKLNPRLTPL